MPDSYWQDFWALDTNEPIKMLVTSSHICKVEEIVSSGHKYVRKVVENWQHCLQIATIIKRYSRTIGRFHTIFKFLVNLLNKGCS